MAAVLRAFAWLRWRMFINALERTGSRDVLERFSLAIEQLGPIMAAVLLIPSCLSLASLGAAAGYALANGESASWLARGPRYLLLLAPILSLAGPLLLPAADRMSPVRLLLLPIGRGTLYVAQSAAALGDVWIVLTLALLAGLPLGLVAGGAVGAALVAILAGLLFVLTLLALSAVATSVAHLVTRDRRRGELIALLFLLVIPVIGLLPGAIAGALDRRGHDVAVEGRGSMLARAPWLEAAMLRATQAYPPELYGRTTAAAASARSRPALIALTALAAEALLLHALGFVLFQRALGAPGSGGMRRDTQTRSSWRRPLPGLSPTASAVARAQLALARRTPRGRAILLSPIALLVASAVLLRQHSELTLAGVPIDTGLALACFASLVCLMATLPFAMNQFAVDGAGLTRVLLLPLDDRPYLAGKAVGNALIAAVPASLCLTAAFVVTTGTRALSAWAAIPLGLIAVALLVSPVAAILSALFPRVVDLNSIGNRGNAHGLAGLFGVLSFMLASAGTLGIGAVAAYALPHPAARLVALGMWCVVSAGICAALFVPARRIFASRRENLATLHRG